MKNPLNDTQVAAELAADFPLGQTGSGKSSGPMRHLIRSIFKHHRSGMLIIASKPEESAEIAKTLAEQPREEGGGD